MEKEIWRLLEVGEPIQRGDECMAKVCAAAIWEPQTTHFGEPLKATSIPHRRKVKIPVGVDYSNLCKKIEDLQEYVKELLELKTKCKKEPTPTESKSVITITESGVYRRRDGKNVTLCKASNRFMIVGDKEGRGYNNDGLWSDYQESPEDIILYVAPLNPYGTPLLEVKVGENLPMKFMYYSPIMKYWQLFESSLEQTARKNIIYAEYPHYEHRSK